MSETTEPWASQEGICQETLVVLKKRKVDLNNELADTKRSWKAHGSFDLKFWAQATKVEDLYLQRSEVDRKISMHSYDGSESEWRDSEQAKAIFQRIGASKQKLKLCKSRVDGFTQAPGQRSLRASFMKLFTTSKMGIGIRTTGAGPRNPSSQSQSRADMIQAYNAKNPDESSMRDMWCPILCEWIPSRDMRAAHLFGYMHGQDTMNSIFGETQLPELFSARNGLLISREIEDIFDTGKIAIVPDVSSHPYLDELKGWLGSDPRNYRVKVIDPSWKDLDKQITPWLSQTYRQLDNRKLQFRSVFRPAARYLYFHYCVQVLRCAWQRNQQGQIYEARDFLQAENGRPCWATPGKYIPKNMLLALVEEMGHDYESLMKGAGPNKSGDAYLLLEAVANQVKAKHRRGAIKDLFDEGASEEEEFVHDSSNEEAFGEELYDSD